MEETLAGGREKDVNAPGGGARRQIIDIHGHIHTPGLDAVIEAAGVPGAPAKRKMGGIGDPALRRVLTDVDARIEDMARIGVDKTVLSPAPPQVFYRADADLALALARTQNDHIAEVVAAHPRRFAGLGAVPLQHVALAVGELERLMGELGLKGVRVNSNINRMELDDPSLEDFYAAAEELGALLFLHPQGFTDAERLGDYFMSNVVGQPLESTLALSHIIFSGVLERFPDLKICVAHGGGFLPFYIGRFDQAYAKRPECRENITKPPSDYLRQIYFDTVLFDARSLAYLAGLVGPGRLVMGTDRPYDMSEADPVGFIGSAEGLTDAEKHDILGATTARLLDLN